MDLLIFIPIFTYGHELRIVVERVSEIVEASSLEMGFSMEGGGAYCPW